VSVRPCLVPDDGADEVVGLVEATAGKGLRVRVAPAEVRVVADGVREGPRPHVPGSNVKIMSISFLPMPPPPKNGEKRQL
jgi:hypothetical protein